MAFWLAKTREGQHSDFIQRFDPRFWTVNFPRPMTAAVVTTAPDALRVDAVFLRKADLAGLIWDSEDRLDHPLLARALPHWQQEGIAVKPNGLGCRMQDFGADLERLRAEAAPALAELEEEDA